MESSEDEPMMEDEQEDNRPRREILCQLLREIEDLEESGSTGIQAANQAGDIVRKIDSLIIGLDPYERLKKVDETLLDVRIMSIASNVIRACVEAIDVEGSPYSPEKHAEKISSFSNGNLMNLKGAINFIPKEVVSKSMYGLQDIKPVAKEKSQRSQRTKVEYERKEPEKITELQKEEEAVESVVSFLEHVLLYEYAKNGNKPINYYEYLIDTDDFGLTVENCFYFTFLVHDGKASLDLDSKNNPIVAPVRPEELKQFQDSGGKNTQVISSLSMEEWESFQHEGFVQKHRKNPQLLNRKN